MNYSRLLMLACLLLCSLSLMPLIAEAADTEKPRLKMTLQQKADEGRKASQKTEAEQLEKAREAAKQRAKREQDILAKQEKGEWESEQREKSQAQFNERISREEKYLQQARDAAKLERKITDKTAETEEK